MIRPSFTRAQVSDLGCVETHIQNLIEKLPGDGETVDLQRLFFNLTIDNSTEFLLGRSINCQTNPSMTYFSEAWDHAEGCLTGRVRLGKVVGLIDRFKKDENFKKACDTVHTFVDSYIAETLQQGQNKAADDATAAKTRRYNLLSELSAVCRDPAQLRSELLNVLLAARDTTAGLLSSIFYFVARHPDVWAALAAEVDQLEGKVPDYDTLKRMRVLRSIIDESKICFFGELLWLSLTFLCQLCASTRPSPSTCALLSATRPSRAEAAPTATRPYSSPKALWYTTRCGPCTGCRPSTGPTPRPFALRAGSMMVCGRDGATCHSTAARVCAWASRVP